jgi:hypothetical protein
MIKTGDLLYWEKRPNRDEVLTRAYDFIGALSEMNNNKANSLVLMDDNQDFFDSLNKYLQDFITSWLEDEELEKLDENLPSNLTHPGEVAEDHVLPEFEGSDFFLNHGETFSIHLVLLKNPTNLRFHFTVIEQDKLYFVKFLKISKNPNLPSIHF